MKHECGRHSAGARLGYDGLVRFCATGGRIMTLMEQPLWIIGVGVFCVGALVAGLMQTGRKSLLYIAIFVTLATAGLVVLERMTVTPREQVIATLHVIAADLEQNDVAAVLDHISEGRPKLRSEAERNMGLVEVVDVDIKRNLKVEVVQGRGLHVAEARFNAVIRFRPRRGFSDEMRPYPSFFKVQFKQEAGKWRIRGYEMSDPRQGIGN